MCAFLSEAVVTKRGCMRVISLRLSSSDVCSASLSPKVFPLLRITGTGFLAYRKKIAEEPELGRISSRTEIGSGSVRGLCDCTRGKERSGGLS
jgi:hypothetical protein